MKRTSFKIKHWQCGCLRKTLFSKTFWCKKGKEEKPYAPKCFQEWTNNSVMFKLHWRCVIPSPYINSLSAKPVIGYELAIGCIFLNPISPSLPENEEAFAKQWKNGENQYFDQQLVCVSPICWLIYTTVDGYRCCWHQALQISVSMLLITLL